MTTELSLVCPHCGRGTDVTYVTKQYVKCENCGRTIENILRFNATRNIRRSDFDFSLTLVRNYVSGERLVPVFSRIARLTADKETDIASIRAHLHAQLDGLVDYMADVILKGGSE